MKTKFLLFFVLGMNFLYAQREKDIQEVVITATRTERNLKDIPIATKVISGKSIEKAQITNFKDFLEQELAGVSFGNHGGSPEINMLGLGAKYILVLLNGERMAGETFDNVDYNRINISEIERVEIVKGASSSLYGSNAIGGVINIITKMPKQNFDAQISTRYGSFEDKNTAVFLGTRQYWGAVSLSASYKSKAPYLLKDTAPMVQIYDNGNIVKSSLGKTHIAGYEDYGINPKLTLNISPKVQMELGSGYYFKERNAGDEESRKLRTQFKDYSHSGKLNVRFNEAQNLYFSASFGKYEKFNRYILLGEKEKNYENSLWRGSLVYDQKVFQKHQFIAGAEFLSESLMSFLFTNEGLNATKNAHTYALFTQQDWKISDNFTLVTGGRYDYHSEFKGHLTLRLSGMYKLGENAVIRGGYAGGFRSPTLKELYTDWYHPYGGGFHISGNTNLKVEKSHNITLSSDFKVKKWDISLVGQYSYIKDKIMTIWGASSRDTLHYANQEEARIISAELMAHYRTKHFSFRAGYAFTHDFTHEPQTRPHSITARAEYMPPFLGKYAPVMYVSGKYFGEMEVYTNGVMGRYRVVYPQYILWRLGLSIPLPKGFQVNAGIDNVLDYRPPFSNFYTSTSAGRTCFIGISWKN